MSSKRPRILIADDRILLAEFCRRPLETEFEVLSIVDDGHAMGCAAAELKPNVIVVDIMLVLNGLDAGQQVTLA